MAARLTNEGVPHQAAIGYNRHNYAIDKNFIRRTSHPFGDCVRAFETQFANVICSGLTHAGPKTKVMRQS